jgi:ubiquinone/menaquinone biosynthesis C-methylase UbiE
MICGEKSTNLQGKPRYEAKIEPALINNKFKIVSCCNCGFTYLVPDINEITTHIQAFYDNDYFKNSPTKYWKNRRNEHREERLKKMENFADVKIETFLDIGCGEGDMLNAAAERYPHVYGQDITNNMNLKKLKIPKDNIFIGPLKEIGFKDNMFEAIYLDSVLEHVTDPVEFLSEIKRILSPGGCLYIGVPNEFSLDNWFKSLIFTILKPRISPKIDPFRNPYHMIGFSKRALRLLIEKCGLKANYLRTFGGVNEFRKYHITSFAFWKTLAFWPIYAIGRLFNNAFYIEAYLTK